MNNTLTMDSTSIDLTGNISNEIRDKYDLKVGLPHYQ